MAEGVEERPPGSERGEGGRRLYRVRRPDGGEAWVDHDELWRLQHQQAEEARRGQEARRRRWLLLSLSGLVGLVLVVAILWPRPGQPTAPVAAPAGPPAAAGRTQPSEGAAAGPLIRVSPPDEGGGTALAVSPPPEERVRAAVRAWAEAWQSQDVAAYLASYAASFEPADGLSRDGWERLRRRRLEEPESIRLEIEELVIELAEDGRAEARFRQGYTSPSYSDVVRKTLELVEEGGAWRIAGEQAVPIPAPSPAPAGASLPFSPIVYYSAVSA